MDWQRWWRPLGVGHFDPNPVFLNLLLPFMNPFEQASAAQRIANIGSPDIVRALAGAAYNRPAGAARGESDWLAGLGGFAAALRGQPVGIGATPAQPVDHDWNTWQQELATLQGDPNLAWFRSLADMAQQVGGATTRGQQRDARAAADMWLTGAPEALGSFGEYLLTPYLDKPQYGSAVTWGTYRSPFQVRGGLVANPWYT